MCDKELNPYIFKIGVRSQEKEGVRSQESGVRRKKEFRSSGVQESGNREYNFYPNQFPNHQSPITNHQSPITNHQSPITNHQLPITNHLKKKQIGGSEVSNCYNQT
ncbi:hypothetical protein [Dolichospermum sp. UHCC 0260]|uniref:hypothetical protein n=1 Tax=Dolichospermum sp. UHCC 0260 TaxID=2590025 RepID=UPI00144863FF|nr:hypothetical protein [Dolichospermum sp. UHCC 0260]MTJ36189.1 hypothetical protein [Dolichospermum sp. UHCC 0260]